VCCSWRWDFRRFVVNCKKMKLKINSNFSIFIAIYNACVFVDSKNSYLVKCSELDAFKWTFISHKELYYHFTITLLSLNYHATEYWPLPWITG
jgi:hypothetical protein